MLNKALRLSLLIVIAVLALSACAPQATATTAPAAPTTAPVEATKAPAPTQAATATGSYPAPQEAAQAAASPTPYPAPSGGGSASGGVTFTLVADKTTASYTVREQLAKRDLPNDAVGTTQKVSGQIVLAADGSVDAKSSKITVDASTLQTDQSMRDNYVRRNILQTDQYKEITFVPTKVEGLANPLPTSGSVNFKLTGDLTIRNVTKPVTWDVNGTIDGDTATGSATTSFQFADFELSQPQVPVVLSVVDKITLKLDLTLQRAK